MIGLGSKMWHLTIFRERFFDAASGKRAQSKLLEEDDRGSHVDCLQDSGAGGIDIYMIDDGIDGIEILPFEVN